MPECDVVCYVENGKSPILEWLRSLSQTARTKGMTRIASLEETGHELRRPYADYLRDSILELRWSHQRVQYRILYSFIGKNKAVLLHGVSKQKSRTPGIDLAVIRLNRYKTDPSKHE